MSDRELLALMTSVMMRDSVPDAFQKALSVLLHVNEYTAGVAARERSTSVPMSRPPARKEEEEEEEPPAKSRRAK